ncbi:hypothetical protein LXL04_020224 [Taraxacum kok-saghyz]
MKQKYPHLFANSNQASTRVDFSISYSSFVRNSMLSDSSDKGNFGGPLIDNRQNVSSSSITSSSVPIARDPLYEDFQKYLKEKGINNPLSYTQAITEGDNIKDTLEYIQNPYKEEILLLENKDPSDHGQLRDGETQTRASHRISHDPKDYAALGVSNCSVFTSVEQRPSLILSIDVQHRSIVKYHQPFNLAFVTSETMNMKSPHDIDLVI